MCIRFRSFPVVDKTFSDRHDVIRRDDGFKTCLGDSEIVSLQRDVFLFPKCGESHSVIVGSAQIQQVPCRIQWFCEVIRSLGMCLSQSIRRNRGCFHTQNIYRRLVYLSSQYIEHIFWHEFINSVLAAGLEIGVSSSWKRSAKLFNLICTHSGSRVLPFPLRPLHSETCLVLLIVPFLRNISWR